MGLSDPEISHCICISKVTKFKANNNAQSLNEEVAMTVFA